MKRWDEEEIELLKELLSIGCTYKEISEEIYRTPEALRVKASKLKIKSIHSKKLTNSIVDKELKNRTVSRLGNYIDAKTHIKFMCNMCSYTWQASPSKVLRSYTGCPKCGKTLKLNTTSYSKKLPINYSICEEYINSSTKILHQHIKCGYIWKARPSNVLFGKLCPKCATSGFNMDKPAFTYCVYFPELDIYKIGISNNYKTRMANLGHKYVLILLREFSVGKDAKLLEDKWLNNIKDHKVNTGLLNSGNTETFRYGNFS